MAHVAGQQLPHSLNLLCHLSLPLAGPCIATTGGPLAHLLHTSDQAL
jgi:hypothetical protein